MGHLDQAERYFRCVIKKLTSDPDAVSNARNMLLAVLSKHIEAFIKDNRYFQVRNHSIGCIYGLFSKNYWISRLKFFYKNWFSCRQRFTMWSADFLSKFSFQIWWGHFCPWRLDCTFSYRWIDPPVHFACKGLCLLRHLFFCFSPLQNRVVIRNTPLESIQIEIQQACD